MAERTNIHGTGIVVNNMGLLVRGASGAGKSLLALELLRDTELAGGQGLLVADDRLDIEVRDGAIIMHAPQAISGLIEMRGRGIVKRKSIAQHPVHLIVDLVEDPARVVEEDEMRTDLLGVDLARCPVPVRTRTDSAHQRLLVEEALAALDGTFL